MNMDVNTTLSSQLNSLLNSIDMRITGYGVCDAESATLTKTIPMDDYKLRDGNIVAIRFKNAVSPNSALTVNGQGNFPVYYKGELLKSADIIQANDLAVFMYADAKYHLLAVDRSADFCELTQDQYDELMSRFS